MTDADRDLQRAILLLRELADLQNGPPLYKYEKEWNAVMRDTYSFLEEMELTQKAKPTPLSVSLKTLKVKYPTSDYTPLRYSGLYRNSFVMPVDTYDIRPGERLTPLSHSNLPLQDRTTVVVQSTPIPYGKSWMVDVILMTVDNSAYVPIELLADKTEYIIHGNFYGGY